MLHLVVVSLLVFVFVGIVHGFGVMVVLPSLLFALLWVSNVAMEV